MMTLARKRVTLKNFIFKVGGVECVFVLLSVPAV